MEINIDRRFFSEQDALKLLMEEMRKTEDQMDITLIRECLCFLYPENAEEDRAYIEKTLPILHEKLGFGRRTRVRRRSRARLALVAVLVVMGILMLASVVASAFGINVINFFIYDTKEYWMIHTKTLEATEPMNVGSLTPSINYDVWGEAVAQGLREMNVSPALPKFIPDGYAYASKLDASIAGFYREFEYGFIHPNGCYFKLILTTGYNKHVESNSHVQKEDIEAEIVFHNGLEIALAQNFDAASASWICDNCRVRLTGTFSMEELRMMINSI